MKKLLSQTSATLIFVLLFSGTIAQTLSLHRSVDWSLAGLRDSLPNYSLLLNMMDYGANNDGVTLNDGAFAQAKSALGGQPGVIYFPEGIYAFSQTMMLSDSIIIRGASANQTILKFIPNISGNLISISGNVDIATTNILYDAFKNDTFVVAQNVSLFQPGDFIRLYFNDSLLVTSSWAYRSVGQIIRINEIAGDTLMLESPLRMDYPLSLNPQIRKVNAVKGVGIECLKIYRTVTDVFQSSNISFNHAAYCWIKGIESDSCNFAHVEISNSTNIKVLQSYFHHAFDYGGGGKAYGVMIHFASGENLIENNIFRHLRHSMILQAGANGNVLAYNYSMEPFWTGVSLPANSAGDMVLHGNYAYANLFESNIGQNIVIDDSHGKNGSFNTFFRNRADLFGIFMNNNAATDSVNFIGNEITNTTVPYGVYLLNGNGHFQHGNNVKGTATPANTSVIPEASLYLTAQPAFMNSAGTIPTIGYPNALSSGTIKSVINFGDENFAPCEEDIFTGRSENSVKNLSFKTYPNPVSDILSIQFDIEFQSFPINFLLTDISGKTILAKEINTETTAAEISLNLQHLSSGIYLLKATSTAGTATNRIMKN